MWSLPLDPLCYELEMISEGSAEHSFGSKGVPNTTEADLVCGMSVICELRIS